METLRRARFVWSILCMLIGYGSALVLLFSAYRPELMQTFALIIVWSVTWLWLPLYTQWGALKKLAGVWFMGIVPLVVVATWGRESMATAVSLTGLGAVALTLAWVFSGLRRA
jgi:uncharacterized membrane protein